MGVLKELFTHKKTAGDVVTDGIKKQKRPSKVEGDTTQIKSATGNAGTFDPKDPNIKRAN